MSFNIFPDKRGKPIDLAIFTSVFGDRCSFEQGYYTISRGCCQDLSEAPFLPKKAKKLLTNMGMCGIIFRRAERLSMCGCGGRAISSKKQNAGVAERQTRWFQVPVKRFVWVQIPSPAPTKRNFCLPKVPFLFIQAAGLVYH